MRHVVGPYGGETEEISELPYRRYLIGTLYPQHSGMDELHTDEVLDEGGGSIGEDTADDPVTLANEWLPSSVGLSFRFTGEACISVAVWGAAYSGKAKFVRAPVASADAPETVELRAGKTGRHFTERSVLDGRGVIRCLWRPAGNTWLVTVTLVNPRTMPEDERRPDPEKCLYQVGLSCGVPEGQLLDYPSVDRVVADEEDEELAVIYRQARTYAIGHGTAADWDDEPTRVWTTALPAFELAAITQRWKDAPAILSLRRLGDESISVDVLQEELGDFVRGYERWIKDLPGLHPDIPENLAEAKQRILERLERAAGRMRRGIDCLSDDNVVDAFRLANRAMAMQMRHVAPDLAGTRWTRSNGPSTEVDYDGDYAWYPFQLAFQLLVLSGLADEADQDREVVDLIWFPTGGGKTEAYLAVAATEILLRRLRDPIRGGGTAVITRYTLRLLTAQQFERAATLACALEVLRVEAHGRLGKEPIRIGLWVGSEVTPNRFSEAYEAVEEIREALEPVNVFQLDRCPWCGTEIVPRALSENDADYGLSAGNDFFRLNCPNDSCPFHDVLPISVVDDELYERPPTIIVGTVDKFARLAWEERAGSFFGSDLIAPPSLIIQDELHLLSGPLGTMVGLYERAIEALVTCRGPRPKLIASTATIRRADEQVRRLFGAEVELFPPSGLDAENSFFARTDRTNPGRLYIGLMSQSHTAATTNVQVSTALLLAPLENAVAANERDALWTLVSYHNTLRELGRSVTQYRDDIPEMLKRRAYDQSNMRELDDDNVVELTSNVKADRLPPILARLSAPWDDAEEISVLVTTSMLGVGVDIPRLGLMLVNGQPKTTAEYIQATSRVGRGSTPGTVVVMLSATKPRDRSHYETFRPYHETLYRQVEPTSVTPFSLPARERALHAALVVLVRHGAGLSGNADAMNFDPANPGAAAAIAELRERIADADPSEAAQASLELDALIEDWLDQIAECKTAGTQLRYFVPSRQLPSLLRDFGSRREGWETPQSMRNVDRQVPVEVIGATPA